MASASGHIPDPSLKPPQENEPGDQAEAERQFTKAEVHVVGFQLKSWHFSRILKASNTFCFSPCCWEERSSLPVGAEQVGSQCLPLQHSWRPAPPPQGQKETGFEFQAQDKETGSPEHP